MTGGHFEMGAMGAMLKIHDASIAKSLKHDFDSMCTKFCAFITIRTIPSLFGAKRPDYLQSVTSIDAPEKNI